MKHVRHPKPARRVSAQKVFLAAVILLCVVVIGGILLSRLRWNPIDGPRAYDYLKQLCEFGPRRSGSPAMTLQRDFLVKHFESLGGKVELQRFTAPDPRGGPPVPMANIIVHWNPQYKERILLCGHYDTLPFPLRDPEDPRGAFVGANDNASGIAVLMELAHHMNGLRLPYGVDFVLFDAEEFIFSESDHFFLGAEYFAREYAAGHANCHYRCGVLLDMVGSSDLQIGEEVNSISWEDTRPLVEALWATAARLEVSEFVAQPKDEVLDDHVPLHDIAGIPTCDVIDFEYPFWHTRGDTPDKCSASSLAKVGWVVYEWLKSQGSRMKDQG
jgi:hypothetical protein